MDDDDCGHDIDLSEPDTSGVGPVIFGCLFALLCLFIIAVSQCARLH